MTAAYPLLIETHGKQSFLFATGRRREAVGASYLVHAVTDWARDALGPDGRLAGGADAEIVVATSGTVLAFVTDRDRAVRAVRAVTGRALQDAPGLGVTGVVGEPFTWDSGGAPDAVAAVFARMGAVRAVRPGPATRFPVLPVTELCPSSGLPVAGLARISAEREPRSAPVLAKLAVVEPALARLTALTGIDAAQLHRANNLLAGDDSDEADGPERIAVVHADGNGLGRLVRGLADHLDVRRSTTPDTAYAAGYRDFSKTLDTVAQWAFETAVEEVAARTGTHPLVLPLVVGGDDLTFVADAAVAPDLTAVYLRRFVELAAEDASIAGPVATASEVDDPRLGMAAGLVITGPHFPFSAAYALADELVTHVAKRAKTALVDPAGRPVPCVALACHVQSDTVATTAAQRAAALRTGERLLTATPYVDVVDVPGAPRRALSDAAAAWLRGRGLTSDLFPTASRFAEETDEGRRVLPGAQVHELRARLRPEPAAADEYLRRLVEVAPSRWSFLDEGEGSLFTVRPDGETTTRFLDALTLSPFLLTTTGAS